jgi:hypothetical protein
MIELMRVISLNLYRSFFLASSQNRNSFSCHGGEPAPTPIPFRCCPPEPGPEKQSVKMRRRIKASPAETVVQIGSGCLTVHYLFGQLLSRILY